MLRSQGIACGKHRIARLAAPARYRGKASAPFPQRGDAPTQLAARTASAYHVPIIASATTAEIGIVSLYFLYSPRSPAIAGGLRAPYVLPFPGTHIDGLVVVDLTEPCGWPRAGRFGVGVLLRNLTHNNQPVAQSI